MFKPLEGLPPLPSAAQPGAPATPLGPKKEIKLNFTTSDAASAATGIKVLVYGRAGMGKTTLCATAPAPIIISAESGLLSLRHKKIPVIIVRDIDEVNAAYDWCASDPHATSIQTVCLDSLTEIAEQVLSAEKAKSKDPRQAYGGLIDEMINLVKKFRDLPNKNVVMTAKEQINVNVVTGVSTSGPKMPGKTVGPDLPYLFDEVFHASVGKDNTGTPFHFLRTKADAFIDAKDRSGVLEEIEYPDLSNIFNKIKGTS